VFKQSNRKEWEMQTLPEPSAEHRKFDELCQGIDDFEPLPDRFAEVVARRNAGVAVVSDRAEEAPGTLDPLILAGLVSPV
jgi:hypothetical protein